MDSGNHVCSLIQSHSALLPKIVTVKNTQNYTNSKFDGCSSLSVIWVSYMWYVAGMGDWRKYRDLVGVRAV
jgi:hypothetical protein